MRTLGIVSSLIALAVAVPGTAAATTTACTWGTTALPVPPGANQFSITVDATDHNGGWAGKASITNDRDHVFSWKNGVLTDQGRTPMAPGQTILTQAKVADENRSGTILVNLFVSPYQMIHPPYLVRSGQWQALGLLPGATWWDAVGINDAGDVLGWNNVVRNGKSVSVVVRWPAGQTTPVEVPGIPLESRAIDLDEDGTMLVGVRSPTTGAYVPNILRNGTLTQLPALPHSDDIEAAQISNGRIIGTTHLNSGYIGTVWEPNLTPRTLSGSADGRLINRDALAIGRRSGSGVSYGVWRIGTLEFTFGSADNITFGAISDDGSFAATRNYLPTVWRCA